MAKPPTVTREATSRWTLGWQGSLKDRVNVPVPVGLAARAMRWLWLRPVKTLVTVAVLVLWAWAGPWAAAALGAVLVGTGAILRSPGVAASGRVGRSYRACQARGKLRRDWPTLMAETGLVDSAGRAMKRSHIRVTPHGLAVAVLNGPAAKTAGHVGAQAQVIAGLLNVHSVRTRKLDNATTLVMINTSDPLGHTLSLDDLPRVTERTTVPIGLSEDGVPILWDLSMSTLLLGLPRSGKSSIIWLLVEGIQRWLDQPRPDLWVIDLKEGVELGSLDPGRGGIGTRYTQDPRAAEKLIHDLANEGSARLKIMAERNWKKWTPERAEVLGARKILLIDEFLALPDKVTSKNDSPLRTILFKLPAAGITVVGASQLTQVDASAVGRLRNFFQCKILLACESAGMVTAALGDEGRKDAPAHLLQLPYDAGRFYMQQEGHSGFVHGKAAFIDDEQDEHLPIARGELVDA